MLGLSKSVSESFGVSESLVVVLTASNTKLSSKFFVVLKTTNVWLARALFSSICSLLESYLLSKCDQIAVKPFLIATRCLTNL